MTFGGGSIYGSTELSSRAAEFSAGVRDHGNRLRDQLTVVGSERCIRLVGGRDMHKSGGRSMSPMPFNMIQGSMQSNNVANY